MLAWLFRQHKVLAPRGFGIWVAFILWMFGSATRVSGVDKFIQYSYKASLYLGATILLLYVFNLSREAVSTERVITVLTIFWMYVVIWGALGVAFPTFNFTSPMERVMPQRLVGNDFVHDLVHPALSQVQRHPRVRRASTESAVHVCHELGSGVRGPHAVRGPRVEGRAEAVGGRCHRGDVRPRHHPGRVLPRSRPLAEPRDRDDVRGRSTGHRGNSRALRVNLLLIFTVIAVVFLSPLKTLVTDRLAHPHSNERRLGLYQESTDRGDGLTDPRIRNASAVDREPECPPGGDTRSVVADPHLERIPGAFLFVWWFVFQFWRLRRTSPEVVLWSHTVILIALVQMPFYDSIGIPLAVIMIAIAIASRELPARTVSLVPSDARVA